MTGLKNRLQKAYASLSVTKKSVIWYTLATVMQNGILFLITPLYTRILTDGEYGVFSVYQSWQQIFSIVAVLALDRCITVGFMKFQDQRKEFLSSVQALMTLLVFVCGLLVCMCSRQFQKLIGLPIEIIITMLVVALMNNTLANWSWYQRYHYSYIKLTVVTVLSTAVMQMVSVLALLFLPFENKGNVLVLSMSGARLLLYGVIYCSVFMKGRVVYRREYWKFALGYSVAVVPHALAQIILNSSDRIMIDKFCGRADAAYYGVTYSAAMVLNIIMVSISSAVQPWFFEKIEQKDFKSIRKQANVLLLLAAFLSTGVSLFAPEILMIMAPSSYRAALWVFPSVAGSVFFNSMYLYFANFESYYEKPYYFSIATTLGAVMNIVLNYIFIPVFGFVAAGYTTLVCYMFFAAMHYVFMRKVCAEKLNGVKVFNLKFILGLSAAVLLLTFGVTVLYEYMVVRYVLIGAGLVFVLLKRNFLIQEGKKIISRREDF